MLTLSLSPEAAERYPTADAAGDAVFTRWQRLRLPADGCAHPDGIDGSRLRERREQFLDAFRSDAPLAALPTELLQAGYTAIVADAEGIIIDERASDPFLSAAAQVRLVRGARWCESTRGTNAIGTALFEGVPIAVVGSAHFERANRGLVCYAAPIRDSSGRVVGVFDVTSDVANASPLVGPLVTAMAATLQRSLHEAEFDRATPGGLRRLRTMIEGASGPAWLVRADGRIHASSAFSPRRVGSPFELDWKELERASRESGSVRLPKSDEELSIRPIVAADGSTLAITAFVRTPRSRRRSHDAFERIRGTDKAIESARSMANRFASSELPMMLLAETGSGKELFAKAIHEASPRANGNFVAVNCGALSSSLLESELFGYAPGAFTGAHRDGHTGLIGEASGGTLFLDEVAEMSPTVQAALLRVLEDGSFRRVGDSKARSADVRIITATCRDLAAMVQNNTFRSDLYFRLRGATITIPALRLRQDRLQLAEELIAQLLAERGDLESVRLGASARVWIESHSWPGNVRELKMALAHALVLADDTIESVHFPSAAPTVSHRRVSTSSRDAAEATALAAALEHARGNMSEAARILGVARTTLYRMKRRHGL